jgi:hypothetical protein
VKAEARVAELAKLPPACVRVSASLPMDSAFLRARLSRFVFLSVSRSFPRQDSFSSPASQSLSLLALALRPRLHHRSSCPAISTLLVSASEIHPRPRRWREFSLPSVSASASASLSFSISIFDWPVSASRSVSESRTESVKRRPAFLRAPFSFFRRSIARGRRRSRAPRPQKSSRQKREVESRDASVTEAGARSSGLRHHLGRTSGALAFPAQNRV